MAKPTVLKTESRSSAGSATARRERRGGRVPVIVYGHGEANQSLSIDEHELDIALHSHTQVFTLAIGKQDQACLVKDVQYDTFGQRILHVDFARVDLSEQVEVEVELAFTGHPKGVADGGQLVVQHPALWVMCRADRIPESIAVDIAELEIGNSLHAEDIALPDGVTLDTHKVQAADTVVGVVPPRVVEEEEPEAVEGEPGAVPAEGEVPAEGAEPAADGEGTPEDGEKKE